MRRAEAHLLQGSGRGSHPLVPQGFLCHQFAGHGGTHLLHVIAAAGTWVNPDTQDVRGRGHLMGPVLSLQIHIYLTLVRASTLCPNHPCLETLRETGGCYILLTLQSLAHPTGQYHFRC